MIGQIRPFANRTWRATSECRAPRTWKLVARSRPIHIMSWSTSGTSTILPKQSKFLTAGTTTVKQGASWPINRWRRWTTAPCFVRRPIRPAFKANLVFSTSSQQVSSPTYRLTYRVTSFISLTCQLLWQSHIWLEVVLSNRSRYGTSYSALRNPITDVL